MSIGLGERTRTCTRIFSPLDEKCCGGGGSSAMGVFCITELPMRATRVVRSVHNAFVDHPDVGADDFVTKLKGQMKPAAQ